MLFNVPGPLNVLQVNVPGALPGGTPIILFNVPGLLKEFKFKFPGPLLGVPPLSYLLFQAL